MIYESINWDYFFLTYFNEISWSWNNKFYLILFIYECNFLLIKLSNNRMNALLSRHFKLQKNIPLWFINKIHLLIKSTFHRKNRFVSPTDFKGRLFTKKFGKNWKKILKNRIKNSQWKSQVHRKIGVPDRERQNGKVYRLSLN